MIPELQHALAMMAQSFGAAALGWVALKWLLAFMGDSPEITVHVHHEDDE